MGLGGGGGGKAVLDFQTSCLGLQARVAHLVEAYVMYIPRDSSLV